jgi:hypothetical protein
LEEVVVLVKVGVDETVRLVVRAQLVLNALRAGDHVLGDPSTPAPERALDSRCDVPRDRAGRVADPPATEVGRRFEVQCMLV